MSQDRKPVLLGIILVSYLMIILDVSVVITGLPKIQQSLNMTAPELSWVQSIYTLTFGGLLLLGARAGDILGRRRMLILGLSVFMVASVGIATAQNVLWLLGSRAAQGVGAAILAPSTLALLTANFSEGHERTRALSLYGAVAGIGASIGLVMGGVLADLLSWRVGFFVNLPVALGLIWASVRYVDETPRRSGQFDVAGALSSTLGMGLLVFGIVRSASEGWSSPQAWGALGAGLLLLVFLVFNEARAAQPIMPLRLFVHRERATAYGARMLFLGAMVGFFFFTTQYMQSVLGYSALEAGLAFLPMTGVNFVVAMMGPGMTRRFGNGWLFSMGLALCAVGLGWLSRLDGHGSYWLTVALPMVLIGAGQGCAFGPMTASGIAGVRREDAGAASGVVNAAHQLGSALGLSVLVVAFAHTDVHGLDAPAALAHRIGEALTVGTVFLTLAWLLVMAFIIWWPASAPDTASRLAQEAPGSGRARR
jgi:MFS family permease